MKSPITITVTLFALAVGSGCFAAGVSGDAALSRKIFPFPTHRSDLDNGLAVISVAYDSPGIIAYYTVVRTGSRNEVESGLSGFAHFFEHMMFRGTARFSQEKYNDVLKSLGADSNAFTSDDWTCYHITASSSALETIMDIESDRFQNLEYDEPSFQKEARAVLGEYNKGASSPFLLLDEKMQDTSFTRHTYKHTTLGFLRDIEDMPNQYAYSRKFFERWYRPDNCAVVVVGDVDHARLVQLAQKYYGGWPRGGAKVDIPQEPPQREEKKIELTWPNRTLPYLYVGYHVPGFDPKSRELAALDLLAQASFSESSPLYRKLVLEEQKVEMLTAGADAHRDPTLFTVLCRIKSERDVAYVRDAIYQSLAKAGSEPISEERLAAVQSHVRYGFAMGLSSPDSVARVLGMFLELSGTADSINQLYATYESVTASDIQAAARKYFAPTNRTVVTLTAARGISTHTRPATADTRIGQDFGIRCATGTDCPGDAPAAATPHGGAAGTSACAPAAREVNLIVLPSSSPLIALRVLFRVGSQDDPPGKEGLAALTAALIAEGGSRKLSYDQILEQFYPMAADISGRADKEVSVFVANVHREKLDEFYPILSGMILEPRFDPADFERLREQHANYLSKTLRGNDDEALGKWTLQLALYPHHLYGHVDQGTVAGLAAITLDDVRQFYRAHYTVSALELGVAGGVDDSFVARVRRDFAALPNAPAESAPAPLLERPRSPHELELTIVAKDAPATAISLGFPVDLSRGDDDFYALAVANSYLGEHRTFNGRLMQNMRGKRGLNYGDYSYIENFIQDGGSTFPIPNTPRRQQYFSIWIRPVPHDKAVFALRQAVRELDMFVTDGLSEESFEATRQFLRNYSKLWVQTLSRRLGYRMDGSFYGRDDLITELDRRLPRMTRDPVNAAIRKHLQSNNLAIAVVTRDAEAFRDAVLSGDPSPLHYDTGGTPEEILAEDKLIERYPLRVNRDKLRVVPVDEMFEK